MCAGPQWDACVCCGHFPRLFTGTHINHPLASRAAVERVDFDLDGPVNVIVDGEILRLDCRSVEILPARWTSSYEEGHGSRFARWFCGPSSGIHFAVVGTFLIVAVGIFGRPAQARLAASRLLPQHPASRGREIRSAARAGF